MELSIETRLQKNYSNAIPEDFFQARSFINAFSKLKLCEKELTKFIENFSFLNINIYDYSNTKDIIKIIENYFNYQHKKYFDILNGFIEIDSDFINKDQLKELYYQCKQNINKIKFFGQKLNKYLFKKNQLNNKFSEFTPEQIKQLDQIFQDMKADKKISDYINTDYSEYDSPISFYYSNLSSNNLSY